MNITIRAQGFAMTPAIDEFVRDQLGAALARIEEDIVAVDVFMKDANGPRGGVDKQALIRVHLRNRIQFALLTTHDDLYGAVTKGVKRVKRAARRQLRKSRHFTKQRMRDLLRDDGLAMAPRN